MAVLDPTIYIPELKKVLGMSRDEIARVLGVHPRTIDRWLSGDTPQRNNGRERLEELVQLVQTVVALFGENKATEWLNADNTYLALLKPREVLLAGRMDRVNAAIHALISGASL